MTQQRVRPSTCAAAPAGAWSSTSATCRRPAPPATRILLAALGSPDPYGRQLDGLGGGISSLSKAVHHRAASHPDADVDYTFAQVEVEKAVVDYAGNCGNCSSAVGPFAIDEGLVARARRRDPGAHPQHEHQEAHRRPRAGRRTARPRWPATSSWPAWPAAARASRSTSSIRAAPAPGGSCRPAARATIIDGLDVSLVDATNPVVFVRARDLGLTGTETPQALDADRDAERAAGEAPRGGRRRAWASPGSAAVPKIALVRRRPRSSPRSTASRYGAGAVDVLGRAISMGNCHRAFPLTVAMCLAVAARIPGTVVAECLASRDLRAGHPRPYPCKRPRSNDVRLGHPSGVLPIAARVSTEGGEPRAETVTVYRTARRLMEGFVRVAG